LARSLDNFLLLVELSTTFAQPFWQRSLGYPVVDIAMNSAGSFANPCNPSTRSSHPAKCGLCDVVLAGQSDVAKPTCNCQAYCSGCLSESIFAAFPSVLKCSACGEGIHTWERIHRDLSKTVPTANRRTSGIKTVGSLAELRSKLSVPRSAKEYHNMSKDGIRLDGIHKQVTAQHRDSPRPLIAGMVLEKDTGKACICFIVFFYTYYIALFACNYWFCFHKQRGRVSESLPWMHKT
jgi:hypothetical protein